MQRLLSPKLTSSKLWNKPTNNSTFSFLFSHSHHHKPFTPLIKQDNYYGSSLTNAIHQFHSCKPHHTVSGTIHGVLSNSFASRCFLSIVSTTHLRVSIKAVKDGNFTLFRAQFGRGFFGFNARLPSYWRGWRSRFYWLTPENVVFGLIIANVAVFTLWQVADPRFMINNFMISLDNFKSGRLHTLITCAFSHREFGHIFTNMLGLYFFGMNIARSFGPEYLLKLYLAGALGGSVLYLVHHAWMASSSKGQGMWAYDPSRAPGLGASGAVNAIMLLDIFLNPRATIYFEFIIPMPAMFLGIFLIGQDIWRMRKGDSNISGSAHLGGAAVAAIAWFRIRKGRF